MTTQQTTAETMTNSDKTSSGAGSGTTKQFKTEEKELLQLIIHSLYSHPEVFLRELVSNASDAIDKLRLESLTQSDLVPGGFEGEIRLEVDADARTLTVHDNGIGMTEEEVITNLGTIAHSGTKQFLARKQELAENPDLIGQFGVGFYSAFMVADKVVVRTLKAGESEAIRWESDGQGEYRLEATEKDGQGTSITLYLKPADDSEESGTGLPDFTAEWTLREVIKKHSDFIAYPVKMQIEREKPISEDEPEKTETVIEDAVLNSQKALWLKPESDISDEEYKEFYSHITHDYQPPLSRLHFKAEGTQEFTSLLFLPEQRPWNYDYDGFESGLALYVQRVLIMNHCEDLLPAYLRFVKGVVDSSDLSLNVSREMLQQDRQVGQIKKAITGKILRWFRDLLKNNREDYEKFWTAFGATLKEGIIREPQQKDKLQPLFLFRSTTNEGLSTLDEYIDRMQENQPAIYFMVAETLEQASKSPYLEQLEKRNYEVLLLTDPIDEYLEDKFNDYKDFKFQSITAADLELDSEEERAKKEADLEAKKEELSPLMETIQKALDEDIKEVRLSTRLTETPVCLVDDAAGGGRYMEQLYKQMGQEAPKSKRILEINPDHAVFKAMEGGSDDLKTKWSKLLYQQALLNEGAKLEDPRAFTAEITALMLGSTASK